MIRSVAQFFETLFRGLDFDLFVGGLFHASDDRAANAFDAAFSSVLSE